MRVILVTPSVGVGPESDAGIFIGPLARELTALGATVRVLSLGVNPDVGEGVDVRVIGRRDIPASGRSRLAASLFWRSALHRAIVEELRAGVVHAQWCFPSGLAMPETAPCVLTFHGPDIRLMERSALSRTLGRRAARRADLLTTVSEPLAESLQRLTRVHVAADNVRAMPVDSMGLPWSAGGRGALVLARLSPESRVHLALEALQLLVHLDQRLHLTIAGTGPERPRLERMVADLQLGSLVSFTEAPTRDAARRLLLQSDVLIDPAVGLGFARQQVEAAMCAVPVVACWDSGGSLGHSKGGALMRLVLPTAEAIADGVLDVRTEIEGPEHRRALATALREEFSAGAVAQRCLQWYEEAVRRSRRG